MRTDRDRDRALGLRLARSGIRGPAAGALERRPIEEQDVRKLFGEPAAVRDITGGKGLIYPWVLKARTRY